MASTHTIRPGRQQRGVTLVELVIAIVVVSIAVTAVLGVLSTASANSAEALVRTQAVAIGNAYLEEALLKPFDDPDGADGEPTRVDFDDVDDYNGLNDDGAHDQLSNALAGLGAYQVQMSVVSGTLGGLPATDVKRVDVIVRHAADTTLLFTGYRTRYP
jgi:MSHA pilin protein MshD